MDASTSANETARLAALREYGILDTPPEPGLDALTRLASQVCGTPMAMLTLVDGERQWFKSRVGIELESTPREASFCAHAIEQPGLFVVADTHEDPRFAGTAHVVSFPHIRFYAGAPLRTPEGHALGTLCVVDRVPRRLSDDQREALRTLAGQAMAQIELRRLAAAVAGQEHDRAERAAREARVVRHNAALVELARGSQDDLGGALRRATRTLAATLDVERAGVWLFAGEDRTELVCNALYRARAGMWESGARLVAPDYPAYFEALAGHRAVAAEDALADPRTAELEPYLRAEGIGAMLDVPVWRDGQVVGVLCCEHVGGPRAWTDDEAEFAANVADLVMLSLEGADRRRAERDARHAQGRGAAVIRAALDCVVMMDGRGIVLDFNPAAERTFGWRAAEAVGRSLGELIVPERFREAHQRGLERHVATGTSHILGERVETYALRSDGTEFPVELTITRVDGDGPPVFTGHLRDITERVEAAAALERSLSVLRATLEAAADGLLVVDREGHVVTANGKFAAMWGIDPAHLVPGSPAPLPLCAEQVVDSDAFTNHILEIRHSPVGESLDDVWLKDGRVLELYSQPHQLNDDTVGRVWSYRDVTARRTAEDEARRTADRMRAVASAAAAVVGAETPAALRAVLEEACRTVLSFDAFFIFAYDPKEHTFHGFGGNDAGEYTPPRVSSAGGTPGERVVRERRSLLTLHADDPAAAGATPVGTGRRSESVIRTPIVVGDEVRGVISVQSYTPELYSAADVEVVEALASLAATALENLRLTAERREAEAALRRSESRFRALFEQFPFSIQIFSAEGETLQENRAWERFFRSRPGDRRRFNPLADPQFAEVQPLMRRGFEGEAVDLPPVLFDPLRLGEGPGRALPHPGAAEPRWLQPSVFPVKDEDGATREVIVVQRDVTEERRALDELRDRERRLAETQRLAHLGSWEWHMATGRMVWSDELYRIYGLEPQSVEMTPERAMGMLHPDDFERVSAALAHAAETGEPLGFDHRIVRPDGTVRSLYGEAGPVRDAQGSIVGMIGGCQDVTERVEALEALRESEERARTLIETAADAIITIGEDHVIQSANPAMERTFGYTAEELVGQSIAILQPPGMHAAHVRGVERYRTTGRRSFPWTSTELVAVRRDGVEIPIEISIGEYQAGGKRIFAGFLRDITERKAAERALREARDELELRVQERTAELAQTNLALEEEVAERARAEEEVRQKSAELQAVFHALPDLYFRLERDGTIVDFQAGQEMGLYTDPEAFLRRRVQEVLPPAAAARIAEGLEQVRRSGRLTSVEYALEVDGGEPQEFEARLMPLDTGGQIVSVVRDITERKGWERELRRREEHFRALIENGSDLIAIIGADGITQYLSPSAERLLGWKAEERVGHSTIETIHPDDWGEVVRLRDHAAKHPGVTIQVQFRYRHGDGSWRVFEAAARTLRPDTAAEGLVVNARDVTERREAEEALRRSEEHFRALIENASDLITVLDEEGTYLYQSPSVHRVLGYSPEDLLGKRPFEFMHPDDVDAARGALQRMAAGAGTAFTVQFRFRHADGSWRVLESTGRRLNPGSAAEGVVVNSRDVTERREAEEALRRSEEHFRAVIENASDLVTILETDGVMRYQSPSVERLFGYRPEELQGRNAFEFVHPDDHPEIAARLADVIAHPGESRTAAFRWKHKDGSWRHVEAMGTTLLPGGAVDGLLVNSRDVTERKRAEEALEAARAEAERAREAAETANQAKSEFLSRMSHELRTPMNSILGFAQLLDRRSPTPEQKKGVDQILRAGRHLLNLINEVLDIARIESDRQQLSLEPVRVDTALVEAINLIRPLAAQNSVTVPDPLPAPGRWVHADRQRLAQVLLNLLSNGVKYNRTGGSVRVVWEEAEGRVRIGVRDTGRGIAPERMAELFVPFARLGAEETGVEGTGLGLALSHRLAEAMGGSLTCESEPGRGSTFWLELPVAEDPSSRLPTPLPQPSAAHAEGGGEARPPATLLYVEDNLANLTLVESLLSSRPEITLVSAMQGRMGLDLAWEHAPDLILLDLHLPDMPGSEVLRRLRADPRTRHTPVVVISADATPGQVERLRAAGAHEYMTKPLDLDLFMDAVDRTLAGRKEQP
jgi:PAS domain S-box-containing protein